MILKKFEKKLFDPKNKQHLDEFKYFIIHTRWKSGCPFELEWPHETIPDMIKDKIVRNMFDVKMA